MPNDERSAGDKQTVSSTSLGARLKRARMALGLGVREAAKLASLSPSMLSKVERDLAQLSLASLLRLAKAYGIKVGDLMDTEDSPVRLFRGRERVTKTTVIGDAKAALLLSGASSAMQVNIFDIPPGGESGGPYSHEGEELAYVIKGEVELVVDGESYVLEAGDLLYYPSTRPHGWVNRSESVAEVLWVTAKGRF